MAVEAFNPRVLFLDIERRPATAYVWGLHDQNVALNQLVDSGGTLCFAAKWQGEPKMLFYSDWQHGHGAMVKAAHALFGEADAIVTYNGDRFDIPKLRGEFLLAGLPPPPPITSIDVYKAVKKLGLISGKLAFVGPLLTEEGKLKHEGMELWIGVINGNAASQRKMQRYCSQDVRLLEKVYAKVKPFIANHPYMGSGSALQCPACGSHQTQSRGVRRTRTMFIQRYQCVGCGGWFDGARKRA